MLPNLKEALDDRTVVEFNTRVDDTRIGIVWSVRLPGPQISYGYLRSGAAEAQQAALPHYRAYSDYGAFRVCYAGLPGKMLVDGRPLDSVGSNSAVWPIFSIPGSPMKRC